MPKTHPEPGEIDSSASSVEFVSNSTKGGSSGSSGGESAGGDAAAAPRVGGRGAAAVVPIAPSPSPSPSPTASAATDEGEEDDDKVCVDTFPFPAGHGAGAPAADEWFTPNAVPLRKLSATGDKPHSDLRRDSMWIMKDVTAQGHEFLAVLPFTDRVFFNAVMITVGVFVFLTTVVGFTPNLKYAAESGRWAHMSYTNDTLDECPPHKSHNITTHAVSSVLWLFLSAAQVATGATGTKGDPRRRWHKFCGRYVAPPVLVVQVCTAFVQAPRSHASWVIKLTTVTLGLMMLMLLVRGLRAVQRREYFEHKECMMDLLLLGTAPAMQRCMLHLFAKAFPDSSRVSRQGATWIFGTLILAVAKVVMTVRLKRMHILRNKIMIAVWFSFALMMFTLRVVPGLNHLLQLCENTLKPPPG